MAELGSDIRGRIDRSIEAIGAGVDEAQRRAIEVWLGLVVTWNRKIDLTAARTDDELVDLMIADALVLAGLLPRGAKVVDVGTGAGAPGMPLALARPDLEVTLVEPLQKRVAFLRTASGVLGSGRVMPIHRVVRARGEQVEAEGARFDVAVSRATLAPPAWLALGARLAPHGQVWVLLAQAEPPLLDGWRVATDLRYCWPLTGASRRAISYEPVTSPRESAK